MKAPSAVGSMRKTAFIGAGTAALAIGAAALPPPASVLSSVWVPLLGSAAVAGALLAIGGWLVAERQRRVEAGERDMFLRLNEARSESAVKFGATPHWSAARRWIAREVLGHPLMVGDVVRVKSLDRIRATLDADGCIEGLPFMREMESHCGQLAHVYRVLDKVYDYGRSRSMRRIDRCVLLVGLRCDGADHGGCDAACYLIWKADWLERADEPAAGPVMPAAPRASSSAAHGEAYSCQYTALTAASTPMTSPQIRGLLGPLACGNVTAAAFAVSQLTRIFNAVQARIGGATYPWKPSSDRDTSAPLRGGTSLKEGEWVRVRTPAEIAATLDRRSKHRGLWFDADMLKHCGQTYRVRSRVERIIDIRTCTMATMKTPCIVLDDAHYSGEFQGFGEQHDFLYWREDWLDRVDAPALPSRRTA